MSFFNSVRFTHFCFHEIFGLNSIQPDAVSVNSYGYIQSIPFLVPLEVVILPFFKTPFGVILNGASFQ
jgi:hypothetical protein